MDKPETNDATENVKGPSAVATDKTGERAVKPLYYHDKTVSKVKSEMPSDDELFEVAELFNVFGDSTRTRILAGLFSSEMCVGCICKVVDAEPSAVSHQLRVLRQAKLVKTRKEGREIYYSPNDDHIRQIFNTALEHIREK